MKRCANPHCKCLLFPSKHNPNQRFCERDGCKRFRDAERQNRYYHDHMRDPEWARQHRERKQCERRRRIETQRRHSNAENMPRGQNTEENEVVLRLVVGVVSMVSGARDADSISSVLQRCMRKGEEIFPEDIFF